MGEQSASRLEGDRYQHLYSWYELLQLLDENSPFEFGFVEHPEAGAADDVTLHPKAGSGLATRYVQVKWHVDHRDKYSFDNLAAPPVSGGRSLLQKLFESWRKLQQQGPVEIWVVSNWPAAEDLGRYIQGRDYKLISDFFRDPPKGNLRTALDKWKQQLGVTPAELRAFCRDLRLRLSFGSISDLETQVDDRLGRHGLRMGQDPRAIVLDEVSRWIEEGGATKRITRESLLETIRTRGLLARKEEVPSVGLWIHGWARRAYERPPTVELDWTRYFDRDTRTVPSEEVWKRELLPELRQ
ncbi:MAG: SAVED domain-containing protein, partial [Archangium sp.]